METKGAVKERTDFKLREPKLYQVIMWNDDFTTMDFVVKVLTEVFYKSEQEAEQLMLQVHTNDEAIVGFYSYDVAVSKSGKAMRMAREEGFPLRITYLPV